MEEKYQTDMLLWENERCKIVSEKKAAEADREHYKAEIALTEKKYAQMEVFVNNNRNVIEEFEQLKKTYKEVIKENYRLKGQYHTTNISNEVAKNEELTAKVTFY